MMELLDPEPNGPGNGERELRINWAGALFNNARNAATPIDWEEAVAAVDRLRDMRVLPVMPARPFLRPGAAPEQSLIDIARDPGAMYESVGALDTCLRFGSAATFEMAARLACEFPLALAHNAAGPGPAIYRATLGIDPFSLDIPMQVVSAYRPELDPAYAQMIQDTTRNLGPPQ